MSTPLVSICSITYNHAPFIRQCLDGFLMQQCDFPIEIIINDDCSTDGTTEIIREYAEKYPDKIFPIFHEENLYSQGVRGMFQKFVYPKARGKYIALCEGDDYWTDPLKLQKQVDFLESHPDYSMCFHKAETLIQSKQAGVNTFDFLEEREYSRREILARWTIPTATVVIRSFIIEKIPVHKDFQVGDILVFLTCSYYGKLYCLRDQMAVYRRHDAGWSLQKNKREMAKQAVCHYKAMKEVYPNDIVDILNIYIAKNYIYLYRDTLREKEYLGALALLMRALFLVRKEFCCQLREKSNSRIQKILARILGM